MPEGIVKFPSSLLHKLDATDRDRLPRDLAAIIAVHMDAIDPSTNQQTNYVGNPNAFIDLTFTTYEAELSRVTTPILITVVSYDWPDRMANIHQRCERIAEGAARLFRPHFTHIMGEVLSVCFLAKQFEPSPAWAAA